MASITYTPSPLPLSMPAAWALVCRYGAGGYRPLPNVVCMEISAGHGADPGSARFRYTFDILNPSLFPDRIEDVLGLDKSGPYVVSQDDRLAVLLPFSSTVVNRHSVSDVVTWTVLFDGFAQVPQGDLSSDSEDATFSAVGVAGRCWDSPLDGAVQRNGPDVTVVSDVQTDIPARFNPDGRPNRVPAGSFAGQGGQLYPTFVDPPTGQTPDATHAFWTVADAAAYILAQGNDGKYVASPGFTGLPNVLADRSPGIDMQDPLGVNPVPLRCHDLDVTGDPWPVALEKLVRPYNFSFAFRTAQDGNGNPYTWLYFFRTDDGDNVSPKTVPLQAAGVSLDPAQSIVNSMSVARDGSKIASGVVIDSQCTRHEIGIVLAPGFKIDPADAAGTAWAAFDTSNPNFISANINKYRVYVANEAGDGYWDFPSTSWKTSPACDFDAIFGKPVQPPHGGQPTPLYAKHRRPGLGTLFSLDGTGERNRAKLYISSDYAAKAPAIWDRSGSWSEVHSQWELLPDRLGIRITTDEISSLLYGPPIPGFGANTVAHDPSQRPTDGGNCRLSLVESQNAPPLFAPNPMAPRVYFLLVCGVESDAGLGVSANPRASSVSPFNIYRKIDARDRFVKHVVCASSVFNAQGKDTTDTAAGGRDDTADATSYAEAVRASVENPAMQGQVRIPWIAGAYSIGDKLAGISGRNISFRTNGGDGQGEAPQYAIVTSLSWTFDPGQSTTLGVSDMRKDAMPPPEHQG